MKRRVRRSCLRVGEGWYLIVRAFVSTAQRREGGSDSPLSEPDEGALICWRRWLRIRAPLHFLKASGYKRHSLPHDARRCSVYWQLQTRCPSILVDSSASPACPDRARRSGTEFGQRSSVRPSRSPVQIEASRVAPQCVRSCSEIDLRCAEIRVG
jgi:hypothetical protein